MEQSLPLDSGKPRIDRRLILSPVRWQDLPATFEVGTDVTTERVQRRLEYVSRQLEWRIAEADRLRAQADETQARLDMERQRLDVQSRETQVWRSAYEAIMRTKTVRAARVPRALYARIRGRLH